jgi:mannose-6-phosphate isomerase
VKMITVKAGEALSLQKHEKRDEFWKIISGDGWIVKGEERIAAKAGDECFIPRETEHRLEGGSAPLVVLEISFGDFAEDDIVRLEDRYGRVGAARTEKPSS